MDNSIFDLSGRAAIVTGGNGGIGLGIAEGLACAGANVSIVGRDEAKTAAAAERLRGHGVEVLGFAADVSDEAAVDDVVTSTAESLGRIDILLNNAGIAIRGLLQDYTSEDWDSVVDVNLKGMFLFSRAVYPHMVRTGGGKVINIGSMTSIFGLDWAPAYGASKGGAVQLAKNMAVAWAKDNIQDAKVSLRGNGGCSKVSLRGNDGYAKVSFHGTVHVGWRWQAGLGKETAR